jgi:FkbM family methyltransferase
MTSRGAPVSNVLGVIVKKGLERFGLKLSRLKKLPIGNDLCLDLSRINPPERIATVFDVGANAGRSAVHFAATFPRAKIYSFEPVESTYRQLVAATHGLPNVRCFHFAMGDEIGSTQIFLQKDSEWNSLAEKPNQRRSAEAAETETIRIRKVDEFCQAEGVAKIDLLKIDTEGFELQVLRGAEMMFTSQRVSFVYSEVTFDPDDEAHTNFFRVHEFLEPLGFRFVALYEQYVHENMAGASYTNALFVNRAAYSATG